MVVHAEVGRRCLCDSEPGDLDGLETFVDVDFGDMRLEYNVASEVAWLVGDDQGDLREASRTSHASRPRSPSRWPS